jgi:hypothetical protein
MQILCTGITIYKSGWTEFQPLVAETTFASAIQIGDQYLWTEQLWH